MVTMFSGIVPERPLRFSSYIAKGMPVEAMNAIGCIAGY